MQVLPEGFTSPSLHLPPLPHPRYMHSFSYLSLVNLPISPTSQSDHDASGAVQEDATHTVANQCPFSVNDSNDVNVTV